MIKKWMAIAAAAVFISGCSSSEPAHTSESKNKLSPLTGTKSSAADRRAAAVVISNHPDARPQTALEEADIVYEMLTEGGITRFLAIYQSDYPKTAGPVRSARDYFIELAEGYDALFLAHGYSPEAKDLLLGGEVDQLNGIQHDGSVFKREQSRKAPHNSYVAFKEALELADQKGYQMDTNPSRLSFLSAKREKTLNGDPAANIVVHTSKNTAFDAAYEYEDEAYTRLVGGKEIRADNIFIIEADHRVVDAKGRLDINLKSGGDAFLIQKGVMNLVKWRNQDGRIVPYTENGAAFVPGKTWIHVIPALTGLNKAVDIETDREGNES